LRISATSPYRAHPDGNGDKLTSECWPALFVDRTRPWSDFLGQEGEHWRRPHALFPSQALTLRRSSGRGAYWVTLAKCNLLVNPSGTLEKYGSGTCSPESVTQQVLGEAPHTHTNKYPGGSLVGGP
jgi:hypothetical protein